MKDKIIRLNNGLINTLKTLDAVRAKEGKSSRRQFLEYIYFDANENCFVSTDGRAMLVIKISNEDVIAQFDGESAFCKLIGETTLLCNSKYADVEKGGEYVSWKKVLYDVDGINVDKFEIPSGVIVSSKYGVAKKYIPMLLCEIVSREVDCVYNPEFFDKLKPIIDEFHWVYFSKIYSDEELEQMNAYDRKIAEHVLPLQLASADMSIRYVVYHMSLEENK